jgi:heme/copper-type cytochrome/quinol oxidase subunit 4
VFVERHLLCFALARARHHLRLAVHGRLSDESPTMTATRFDRAPGDRPILTGLEEEASSGLLVYSIGFALAVILTVTSIWVANISLLWGPGIPLGLAVLAIAQMGVHLVFFAHHHRARQYQRGAGARVWRAHRDPCCRQFAVDHEQSQQRHDAARTDEFAPAALSQFDAEIHPCRFIPHRDAPQRDQGYRNQKISGRDRQFAEKGGEL